MGWGNESEYSWFMSHYQDGHHVQFSMVKTPLLWNEKADDLEKTFYTASGTQAQPNLFN